VKIQPFLRDFQAEGESPAVGLFYGAAFSTALLPINSAKEPSLFVKQGNPATRRGLCHGLGRIGGSRDAKEGAISYREGLLDYCNDSDYGRRDTQSVCRVG